MRGAEPLSIPIAAAVALVMKTILEMSDDVKRGRSPLDTQGRLLRLQNSIQKNRARIQALCNDLARELAQGIVTGTAETNEAQAPGAKRVEPGPQDAL